MAVNTTQQLGGGVSTLNPFPERVLGAKAIRKKELLKWLASYVDVIGPVDENQSKEILVKITEGYQMQGKLPSLPGQSDESGSKVPQLENEVAELRKLVEGMSKGEAPVGPPPATFPITSSTVVTGPSTVAGSPEAMPWKALREHARSVLPDFSMGMKRDEILQALKK